MNCMRMLLMKSKALWNDSHSALFLRWSVCYGGFSAMNMQQENVKRLHFSFFCVIIITLIGLAAASNYNIIEEKSL